MNRLTVRLLVTLAGIGCLALSAAPKDDLPYTTIDRPEFIPASEASFLHDTDRLIGVTDGRVAKAYPAGILAQHGVAQDQLADGPIAVTW